MTSRVCAAISVPFPYTHLDLSREVDINANQFTERKAGLMNSKYTYAGSRKAEQPALLRQRRDKE